MLQRKALTAVACLLAAATPGYANDQARPLNIRGGPLSSTLQELATQTRIELLFDRALVSGYRSSGLKGSLSPHAALDQLLANTALVARRSSSGAWIVEQRPEGSGPEEVAAPEILVIGRLTHNVDIRRRENDIQPYQVWTGRQVVQAHRDNLDQFFRSRVTGNTQVLPPSLLDNGETVSEIDLRGLGTDATLILLDGRRMPGIPSSADPLAFRQPDLNAIPLHAIERVETLTGTAGGIYGFGALGGVANIVLKRDYRGAEIHGTAGITSRGDARRLSLEGRVGFTPDGGRTDVMLYLSHARARPLLVGQAGYALRDLEEIHDLDPSLFENLLRSDHYGNSIGVYNAARGQPLVFTPEHGGGTLGSDRTFLPVGFEGSPTNLVASLTQNAGIADLSLPDSKASSEVGSTANTTAVILNIRHSFGSRIEAYVDAIVLRNRGRHRRHPSSASFFVFPGAAGNPFNNFLRVTFPIADGDTHRRTSFDTRRTTAGLVASLPFEWRGTAEATFGSVRHTSDAEDISYSVDFFADLNPFGSWEGLQEAATENEVSRFNRQRLRTRYREQSLRLAGPLFETGAGPTTLTLLAEHRSEAVPSHTGKQKFESSNNIGEFSTAARSSRTTSFYGELKAPLTGPSLPFFRNLELQLAVRRDALRAEFSRKPAAFEPFEPGDDMEPKFAATSYTAGAKLSPVPGLTLRGSYATGRRPPPLGAMVDVEFLSEDPVFFDPKRGNRFLTSFGFTQRKLSGSPDLELVRASTMSAGVALQPFGEAGPRLSVDYSRVRRTGDPYVLSELQVLAHEEDWPERVVREPLTDEDRAQGFTGGRITMIDSRAINGSSRTVKTIDTRFDWPIRLAGGQLRPYGALTYQMQNRTKGKFDSAVEHVGYRTGPLKLRANAGLDWVIGPTSFGANLQYFGRYRVILEDDLARARDGPRELYQGSRWIPSQAYVDLYASRRFTLAGPDRREISLDVGVINLFDKAPPREIGVLDGAPGYSRYGDPRRRRFDVTLSSAF